MDIPQKRCSSCPDGEQWHPATAEFFYHNKSNKKDGLTSQCKTCISKKRAEYESRPDVREQRRIRQRAYVKDYRNRPGVREKELARKREYRSSPEVKKQNQASSKIYRSRPEVQERIRLYKREYSKRPHARETKHAHTYAYYRRPGIRERTLTWHRKYYRRPGGRERTRVNQNNRRARKMAVSGAYTSAQIQALLKRQKHCCYYCSNAFEKRNGQYIYHIDHTFPLSRVSSDIPANDISYLVLACPQCNLSKGNKYPHEFYEGGKLL